jgi:hypothetical protein
MILKNGSWIRLNRLEAPLGENIVHAVLITEPVQLRRKTPFALTASRDEEAPGDRYSYRTSLIQGAEPEVIAGLQTARSLVNIGELQRLDLNLLIWDSMDILAVEMPRPEPAISMMHSSASFSRAYALMVRMFTVAAARRWLLSSESCGLQKNRYEVHAHHMDFKARISFGQFRVTPRRCHLEWIVKQNFASSAVMAARSA